jgi:Malectin domain
MKVFLITTTILLAACQHVHTAQNPEVIIAVNAGGGAYTATYGVTYAADTNTEGYAYVWGFPVGGTTTNLPIYLDTRYSPYQFTYNLAPIDDGFYVIHMSFRDNAPYIGARLFDVVLNGAHKLLDNFDMCATCGQYNVCNQAFYFNVCNGMLTWNGETSMIVDGQVTLTFISEAYNAVVDAFFLMKGKAKDALTIIPSRDVIFFDPAYDLKCNKGKKVGQQ